MTIYDFNAAANPNILSLRAFPTDLPELSPAELKKRLGLERVYKLSFNENPYGPSPKALAAMQRALGSMHLYPDSYGMELVNKITQRYKVAPEQVILSNGADEMINLVAQTFLSPGDEVLIPAPTFGAYRAAAQMTGAVPVMVELDNLAINPDWVLERVTDRTRLIYICNPNNPTGTILSMAEVERFLANLSREIIVVLDEAYNEYTDEPETSTGLNLLAKYPNAAVIRTFSKIYALAAARVGYLIAHPEFVALVHKVRPPFNVNSVGQAGAIAALEDTEYIETIRQKNRMEKLFLIESFNKLGLKCTPSQTNFIMVDTGFDCGLVYNGLARRGVVVRPAAGWGLPTSLRISIGSHEENLALVDALSEVLNEF